MTCGSRSLNSAVSHPAMTVSATAAIPPCPHRPDAVEPVGRVGVVAGCVGENDPAEAVRCVGAEPLSDHAAHRQAAPVRPPDIEVVEDGEHVAAEALHRIGAGRHAGLAVTAAVIADHPKVLRQRLHLRLPHPQIATQRIRQHQRRTAVAPFNGNIERAAVGVDHGASWGGALRCRLILRGASSEASSRSIRACETP